MDEDGRTEALAARVRAFLTHHGATEAEIARAEADDMLDLLAADRLLVPAERRYTLDDVVGVTGMPAELVNRFWRALGFAGFVGSEPDFTDLDIEAISVFQQMAALGATDVDTAVHLARVVGASMARIADAMLSPAAGGVPGVHGPGDTLEEADRFAGSAPLSIPAMARLLEFVWRRHVQASIRRAMLLRARRHDEGQLPVLAVGFADMVGYTIISQQLSETELAALVTRFEEVSHDTVVAGGGRVVKMIGDEVMFVADSALAAARISLGLVEAHAEDDLLSDVRVALSMGRVLLQDGDFFGPTVNLASRAVASAHPGTVVVTTDFRDAALDELADPTLASVDTVAGGDGGDGGPGFELRFRALRPRYVKDIGRVFLWALDAPGTEATPAERRVARRWQRLSEVLHDLEEYREEGERVLSGSDEAGASER